MHNYRLQLPNGQSVGAKFPADKRLNVMRKRMIQLLINWDDYPDHRFVVEDILKEPGMMFCQVEGIPTEISKI